MTPPAPQKTNVARAIARLRDMIFDGELAPDTNHLETALAKRLGMSRTPVREAAMVLQEQGLVAVQARKGVRILPIAITDMQDIYELLTVLESHAAANAARRALDAAALAPLAGAIDAMEAALDRDDLVTWAAADDRFHAVLVELGGNARLAVICGQMADQVRRARRATLFLRPKPLQSNADHRAVLDAIKAGDPARAAEIHKAHRLASQEMLIGLLRRNNLQAL